MSQFAIRTPYLIVVVALIIAVVGGTALVRMPVDMFPNINIPLVVVATFYNGMPPEQIETDITSRFERQFTLASGIEHIESRSLPGAGAVAAFASWNIASRGTQVRCIKPSGVSGHCGRGRFQRNPDARPGAVHGAESDGECSGGERSATLRRRLPA